MMFIFYEVHKVIYQKKKSLTFTLKLKKKMKKNSHPKVFDIDTQRADRTIFSK